MISILILSYNAYNYTAHTLQTLKRTKGVNYEVIVLDNNSNTGTKKKLVKLQKRGLIDKLIFEKENTYFARGNNIAAKLCNEKSEYILLLNSDVEIRDSHWLEFLLKLHKKGITSYGVVNSLVPRADGYCLLIDKKLYNHYQLDENFQWWWSVTKLQGQLLSDGFKVSAVLNHNHILYHYGGKSGDAWMNAKGMETKKGEIESWFNNNKTLVINTVNGYSCEHNKFAPINISYFLNKQIKKVVYKFNKSKPTM
ncbi:glycosyltransferase [Niallia circulans]|uniref:glycosyltransferase family 2 protein n=1 Tax=Niallia circulans TaxID=1397 RepID=UPI00148FB575|nr:glycosyltransferase [Niallia circulans]QJX64175.1 glycosyltransferase [Niallia circulans]